MANLKIEKNYPLSAFTTFRLGGPAKILATVESKEDLLEVFDFIERNNEKFFVLGGGSNLLISDAGFDGVVIKMENNWLKFRGERLDAGAGASLTVATSLAAGSAFTGLEWSVGIPRATLGGSLRGNAGAFGACLGDLVETVEVFNIKSKTFSFLSRNDCQFAYRESIFKSRPELLIFATILRMKKDDSVAIQERMANYLKTRSASQPRLPSAGCVFKNLFLEDVAKANPLLAREAEAKNMAKGGKIGAGWLIELVGLKGKSIGGAKVSLEHANFIVNTGGQVSAQNVYDLIAMVKKTVRTSFNIELEEEIQYLGF